jgi:hypothetical protein
MSDPASQEIALPPLQYFRDILRGQDRAGDPSWRAGFTRAEALKLVNEVSRLREQQQQARREVLEEAAKMVCRHCRYDTPFLDTGGDGTYGHHFRPTPSPTFCYKCKATAIWETLSVVPSSDPNPRLGEE